MQLNDPALEYSAQPKLGTTVLSPLASKEDLSLAYTPGIAKVASLAANDPNLLYTHSFKRRNLAVISDGSAVLGLGNLGPYGAYPVMEGKAMLFKKFGDIDAIPILLDAQNPEAIINTVRYLAPSFAAINLEDIAAPNCFTVEDALLKILPGYPLLHDDQHGTAVVVLAALINSLTLYPKAGFKTKIVISGAGAAGWGITLLLRHAGYQNICVVDSQGIISQHRKTLDHFKARFLTNAQSWQPAGTLIDALRDAHVFIGVSKGGIVSETMIKVMAPQPIIIAMSNPVPEIDPQLALKAGAGIVATGRSDYLNQVNNALAFPGIFAAAIEHHQAISHNQRLAAAYAIVSYHQSKLTPDNLMPSILDFAIHRAIKAAVSISYKS